MLIFQLIAIYFKLTAIEFANISWQIILFEVQVFVIWVILNWLIFGKYSNFKNFSNNIFYKKKK